MHALMQTVAKIAASAQPSACASRSVACLPTNLQLAGWLAELVRWLARADCRPLQQHSYMQHKTIASASIRLG